MKALCDFLRDFALDGEHVFQIAIVLLCPDVRVAARVDQLGIYVQPGSRLADAAFQYVGCAQLIADLTRIVLAAIFHHASAADDLESGNLRQLRQKVVLNTVGKGGVLFVVAQVFKRKHRDSSCCGTAGLNRFSK